MQHKNQGFFHGTQTYQITGNSAVFNLGKEGEKQAVAVINRFKAEKNLSNALVYLEQIKKLALLNVKTALRFFKESKVITISSQIEINNAMDLAYEEMGLLHSNPEFLCEAFYRLSCFEEYNPFEQLPLIQKSFQCLELATKMKGQDATFASYIFAYLYAGELGFCNFNYSTTLCTLSWLYSNFSIPLRRLTPEEKNTIRKTKNIDYDRVRLEGEIFFANMGCAEAIKNMIKWYEQGTPELNIEPNIEECRKWEEKLEKLPDFLIQQYKEHFEIALQNTKKYGYCDGTGSRAKNYLDYIRQNFFEAVNMSFFIKVLGLIQGQSISSYIKMQNSYRQEFVNEANAGNIAACLYLANDALSCDDKENAKFWYKKILETDYSIYTEIPFEVICAARSCWEFALEEKLPEIVQNILLKKAADLGCYDSALLFGKKCLEKNHNEQAIKYFDLAMKNTIHGIPNQISDILNEFPSEELKPYFLYILGEGVKRHSHFCLDILIDLIANDCSQEIKDAWEAIQVLRKKNILLDGIEIDKLITKTIKNYEEGKSYQRRLG